MLTIDVHGFSLVISDLERPYFESAGIGQLVVQQCAECSLVRYPPGDRCPRCGSASARWQPNEGRGRVYSCVIVHHSVRPQFVAPYAVGLVELDQYAGVFGAAWVPRLLTNIFDGDGTTNLTKPAKDGTPVEVVFEPLANGLGLPQFKVAREP
jgi:uncharacterized protein